MIRKTDSFYIFFFSEALKNIDSVIKIMSTIRIDYFYSVFFNKTFQKCNVYNLEQNLNLKSNQA